MPCVPLSFDSSETVDPIIPNRRAAASKSTFLLPGERRCRSATSSVPSCTSHPAAFSGLLVEKTDSSRFALQTLLFRIVKDRSDNQVQGYRFRWPHATSTALGKGELGGVWGESRVLIIIRREKARARTSKGTYMVSCTKILFRQTRLLPTLGLFILHWKIRTRPSAFSLSI